MAQSPSQIANYLAQNKADFESQSKIQQQAYIADTTEKAGIIQSAIDDGWDAVNGNLGETNRNIDTTSQETKENDNKNANDINNNVDTSGQDTADQIEGAKEEIKDDQKESVTILDKIKEILWNIKNTLIKKEKKEEKKENKNSDSKTKGTGKNSGKGKGNGNDDVTKVGATPRAGKKYVNGTSVDIVQNAETTTKAVVNKILDEDKAAGDRIPKRNGMKATQKASTKSVNIGSTKVPYAQSAATTSKRAINSHIAADKAAGGTSSAPVTVTTVTTIDPLKALQDGRGFAKGGVVDYTGLAMVHGSKSRPEVVLNYDQLQALKSTLFESTNIISSINSSIFNPNEDAISSYNASSTENNAIQINGLNMNLNVAEIANDYDARRAGQQAFDEMVRIARKSGNRSVSRR